jgi:hypothetical protein
MKITTLFILTIILVAIPPTSATIIHIPDDYPTIQQGIDASTDGDTVLVQPGTYVENINFNGHNIVLGSLFLTTGDTTYIGETVIDGDSSGSVVKFESGEDSTAVITGLTLQNGFDDNGGAINCSNNSSCIISHNIISNNTAATYYGGHGGGIFCGTNSNPYIYNNIIISNNATGQFYPGSGGAIYCSESSSIIAKNTICYNSAGGGGGGIYCFRSPVFIKNNLIMENHSGRVGGGIYCHEADLIVKGNTIMGNFATGYSDSRGGGISLSSSNAIIENNFIIANFADSLGGGIRCVRSSPAITNSILYGNVSSLGGGIFGRISSNPEIANCILWGDSAIVGSELEFDDSSNPLITYSNIEGGWEGEGNIDADPLFRDPENGDFHLMSTACGDPHDSPCIDAGPWGLGELRSDMGAYGGGDSAMVAIDDYIDRLPSQFTLLQNYPNPFNASTVIRYSLPEPSQVTIKIYDILGRRVEPLIDDKQQAGYHQITWNAAERSSGIYLYRIQAGDNTETRKMLLVK